MSASLIKYLWIDHVEDLNDYQLNGYHPIHIGDRLNDRYQIVHKLGHGSYSTVWLAVDEKTTKYVAVKVCTSDADHIEIDVLSQMTQTPVNCSAWDKHELLITPLLDHFEISGPNGIHECLVTIPARCCLRNAKDAAESNIFPIDVARSLAAQLTIALSHVHARGYAHGDLNLENVLLQLPSSLDDLTVEQLYARYGEPVKEPVVCSDLDSKTASGDPSVPSYGVIPVWFKSPEDGIALDEAKLLLSDFGVAFRPDDKSQFEAYTRLELRSPEAFFEPETPLTLASEIWSLGCLIFELLAKRTLLCSVSPSQDTVTLDQVELQGQMPPTWWMKWEARSEWYDEEGRPLSTESHRFSWERRFEEWVQKPRQKSGMGTLAEDELDALSTLLQSMLSWNPSERPDISEVLMSDWMTKWALPVYHNL